MGPPAAKRPNAASRNVGRRASLKLATQAAARKPITIATGSSLRPGRTIGGAATARPAAPSKPAAGGLSDEVKAQLSLVQQFV
jgi:hypothetical protein